MNLETTYSDDSSVFSGLQDILSPTDEENLGHGDGNINFGDQYLEDSTGPLGKSISMSSLSGSEDRFNTFRNMQSVADKDSAFGGTDTSASPSILSVKRDHNNNNPTFYQNHHHKNASFSDHDDSTVSFDSVHDVKRPKGKTTLVSEVNFHDQNTNFQENQENQEPEGQEERITAMLQDFEKEMDANLEIIKEDEVYIPEFQDEVPRRVKSEDEKQILTHQQAKRIQQILHQARQEVEVLRDNNEQYMSEIEQTDEEHRSEMKLLEERTKQRIADMKVMHQEEIDALVKEKDSGIVEAGRQAERYAESGRKQINSLKRQIEKLKAQANGVVKKTVEDAIASVSRRKDEEMASRLGALRKSYENQLEKMRVERDNDVKGAVNDAISAFTRHMVVDRDRGINETILNLQTHLQGEKNEVFQSLRKSLDESTHKLGESRHELIELRQEREATFKALESVKENVYKHYPEQMEQMRKNAKNKSGAMALIREGTTQSKNSVEGLFKDVMEAFAFLLDNSESQVATAKYLSEIEELKQERKEVYIKARKELLVRHRAETEQTKKDQEDWKDKVHRLEESMKNLRRDKKIVDEKLRRATENRRAEIAKMEAEKSAVIGMEKGRKELAVAMATGQLELAHSMSSGKDHFLKPKGPENKTEAIGSPSMNDDSHDEIEASRSCVNEDCSENIVAPSRSGPNDHLLPPPPLPVQSTSASAPSAAALDAPTKDIISADPDAIKTSLSEASDSTRSARNSRSVLGMVRDQSKGMREKDHTDNDAEKQRKEPSGSKEKTLKPPDSLKKKSFAILRSFKSMTEREQTPENPRDPDTSTQGKEPEGKTESSHVRASVPRRARKIKKFLDHLKAENSTRTRASLDGSLSSLKTNTGNSSVCSSPQNLDIQSSKPKSEGGYGRLDDELGVKDSDRENEKNIVEDNQGEKSYHTSRKTGWKKREGKKRSPLHMFANYRNKSPKAENNPSSVKADEEQNECDATTSEPKVVEKMEENNWPLSATKPGTLNLKKGLPKESRKPIESTGVRTELTKETSGPNPMQNLTKPPLPGFHGNCGEISPPPGHFINGKKQQCPEWADIVNASESQGGVRVPGAISLRPSAKAQHVTPAAGGHTMCLRPLSVTNTKGPNFDSISGMSTDSSGYPVAVGGASDTATLTDDDYTCPAAYDSQQQMRNFPSLAGEDDSDDDSRDESIDKYQSAEPPAQFARNYPSPKHGRTRVPIVISRSIDEQSPVIFMDSESSDSRPIVVQGQPIYREPGLSAFVLSPKRGISHTSSPTASSEATTAVTAHTFHTFKSSLQSEPKTPLPTTPRDMQRPGSSGSSSKRAANFAASLRSRRNFKRTAEI